MSIQTVIKPGEFSGDARRDLAGVELNATGGNRGG